MKIIAAFPPNSLRVRRAAQCLPKGLPKSASFVRPLPCQVSGCAAKKLMVKSLWRDALNQPMFSLGVWSFRSSFL
jgi:hypothetical protein